MIGRIHSFETCGTVDGPGIRFVIFMQGCPLRCQYCHNPDTWDNSKGNEFSVDELIEEIVKYRSYMNFSGGGITITGGEPLLQAEFVLELFKRCRALGIHTALDTSGFIFTPAVKAVLEYTDLILLDIKSINPETFTKVTTATIDSVLTFAKYASDSFIKTWIRFVLVPGLTDNLDEIEMLSKYINSISSVDRIEVLPFHKMGEYKWEALGYQYQLKNTESPSKSLVSEVKEIFKKYNPETDVK